MMKVVPENSAGKRAVGLTSASIVLLGIFLLFETMGFILLVAILLELAALVLSIKALRKERTILTYCALIFGVVVILFLLSHSLFIQD
ncbi:MAG TPA: hypothetical protein VFW58_01855 [Trichococcus sp.]|nr:hypothetical protein [Trichococcus sp.]